MATKISKGHYRCGKYDIKKMDDSGLWYVYDGENNIVAVKPSLKIANEWCISH